MNVMQEFKDQIKRLETERDILREKLTDEIQWNRNIPREKAAMMVNLEIFQGLQRSGL